MIGGGTGAPSLLVALRRELEGSNLSIVLPVSDTGRSTGAARRLLGIPAPGDLRHCLSILAGSDSGWGCLMETRLSVTSDEALDGMATGNLVLGALAQREGDIGRATSSLALLLGIEEGVFPVSVEDIHLCGHLADGSVLEGELNVRRPGKDPIVALDVVGENAGIWEDAAMALDQADSIILGPGSLWTSIGAVLVVPGVRQSLVSSGACLIFVCNTTTQPGQTDGLDIVDHVAVIENLAGRQPDWIVLNSQRLSQGREAALELEGLYPLIPDVDTEAQLQRRGIHVVEADLLDANEEPELWDKLPTAYHDMARLASTVGKIVASDIIKGKPAPQ